MFIPVCQLLPLVETRSLLFLAYESLSGWLLLILPRKVDIRLSTYQGVGYVIALFCPLTVVLNKWM